MIETVAPMPTKLRTNLRALRKAQNLTPRELLKRTELSAPALHTLETKSLDRINASTMRQLKDLLGCTLDELIYFVDEE